MIHICALPGNERQRVHYLVADRLVSSDFSFDSLTACRAYLSSAQVPALDIHLFVSALPDQVAEAATIYCGLGWLGGQWRQTTFKSIRQGYWLNVAEIGDFYVAEEGSVICVQSQLPPNNEWLIETIVGPALTLALALQGTFCLHASAVVTNEQIVAFIGESGWGKSTLTAYLNRDVGRDWHFVADDVLPVYVDGQAVACLPHFPQLKMPADQQWGIESPHRLPLTAVYLIEQPAQRHDSVEIQPLSSLDATLALVRHSVAAKLFDEQLLAKHLAFAAQLADRVPVKKVVYPRIFEALPAVSAALTADLTF